MSDLADRADKLIHAEIAASRARLQQTAPSHATGYCFFCDEATTKPNRFCDVNCRNDYEVENAARLRAGKVLYWFRRTVQQ